ncbi:MAG TPA: PAS domain S-box protein, partial [Armatimonadota bacterium]|nr:PAS domain S-box protein [Armatimonadota bacterium]
MPVDDGRDRVLDDIRALTGLGCVVFDDEGRVFGPTDGVQAVATADLLAPAARRAVAAGAAVVCRWPALGLACGAAPFGGSDGERAAVVVGPARERGVRARAVARVAREHGATPEALRERLRALPSAGETALLAAAQLAASALSGVAAAEACVAADPFDGPLARSLGLLQERILEVGTDGRILRCTPAGYDSGNDVEDLIGRHVTEFIEAGMRNQAERDLMRAWETGSALSVVRGVGRGGTPKHLAIAISRRDRPAGPATSVIGVVRDMTALHEARRASDRRTAQARLMADVAHALADPESLEWLMEEVTRVLREGMRFLASSAHISRQGGWELITSHAMSPAFLEEICPAATLRPHDHPLLQARQVTVSHPGQWEVSEEARQREGLGTVVALPIADHNEVLGLLTLASRGRREVAEDERAFLALVAGALGAAVRRCLTRRAAETDLGLAARIAEACGDALVVVERHGGRVVWWNRAFEILLGLPESGLTRHGAGDFIRDSDLEFLRQAIAEAESSERWPVRLRVRGRRYTGEPRAIDAVISPLSTPEGAETLLAVLRDATDDELLRDQERLLANAVTAAAEIVIIIDTEGRITYTNPSAARLLGLAEADLIGRSLEQMVAEANSPEAVEQMREEICLGRWRGDFALRTQTGATVWVRGSSGILCDDDGSALSVIIVGSDVTRERQLQTQFMASEKLAAVGQLASGIAHELNNIIGAMSGYAQLAKASGTR